MFIFVIIQFYYTKSHFIDNTNYMNKKECYLSFFTSIIYFHLIFNFLDQYIVAIIISIKLIKVIKVIYLYLLVKIEINKVVIIYFLFRILMT